MMKEKRDIPWKVIVNHLKQKASAEEEKRLEDWRKEGANELVYGEIEAVWAEIRSYSSAYTPDLEDCWKRLERRTGGGRSSRSAVFTARRLMKVVASLLLIVSLAGVFYLGKKVEQGESRTQVYSSVSGKSEVMLPDGSSVWLNAGSRLKYSTSFIRSREVELMGEGLFTVKKSKASPFVVAVGEMQVKVHGTVFNVNAYRRDSVVKVALHEGIVSLSVGGEEFFMQPGEVASYNKRLQTVEIRPDDVAFETFWANRSCSFEAKSLAHICRYLERWYQVEIELDPAIAETLVYTFTLTNESLETVLQIMSHINPIKYTFLTEKSVKIEHVEPHK